MNAMKNLVHMAVLAVWGLLGVAFTLSCLFGAGASFHTLVLAAGWWLWFAGLAAATTAFTRPISSPLGVAAIHAVTYLALCAVPRVFPLSLLRLGIDLLANR